MRFGDILKGIPNTGRDVADDHDDKVVSLEPRNRYEMPAAGPHLWRQILKRADEITALFQKREADQQKRDAALASAERQINQVNLEILDTQRKLRDDLERWHKMVWPIDRLMPRAAVALAETTTAEQNTQAD